MDRIDKIRQDDLSGPKNSQNYSSGKKIDRINKIYKINRMKTEIDMTGERSPEGRKN
jgi:hypothetical protein